MLLCVCPPPVLWLLPLPPTTVMYDKDAGAFARYGCIAKMTRMDNLPDGRMMTLSDGVQRFRIVKMVDSDRDEPGAAATPYLVALVQLVSDTRATDAPQSASEAPAPSAGAGAPDAAAAAPADAAAADAPSARAGATADAKEAAAKGDKAPSDSDAPPAVGPPPPADRGNTGVLPSRSHHPAFAPRAGGVWGEWRADCVPRDAAAPAHPLCRAGCCRAVARGARARVSALPASAAADGAWHCRPDATAATGRVRGRHGAVTLRRARRLVSRPLHATGGAGVWRWSRDATVVARLSRARGVAHGHAQTDARAATCS